MDMTEDIHSPYDAGWEKILSSLQDIYAEARLDGRSLADTAQKMRKFLADDLKNLSSVSPLIFNDDGDHDDQTHQVVNLLHSWHQQGLAPSLLALCMHALRLWGLEINPGLKHALTMAALLGEVDNTLPYHNNMHYRKVMLQLLRLIDEHQRIYAGTTQSLATEQIVLLLIAVCIHDLGHDGKGNTIKGVFVPGRLEKQSYDLALPYLRACGLTDEKMLADLRVMLLTTVVHWMLPSFALRLSHRLCSLQLRFPG